jgi:hypothetical protein
MFEGFNNKAAEKLRGQYIKLNMFHESWIPSIKVGSIPNCLPDSESSYLISTQVLSLTLPIGKNRLQESE